MASSFLKRARHIAAAETQLLPDNGWPTIDRTRSQINRVHDRRKIVRATSNELDGDGDNDNDNALRKSER